MPFINGVDNLREVNDGNLAELRRGFSVVLFVEDTLTEIEPDVDRFLEQITARVHDVTYGVCRVFAGPVSPTAIIHEYLSDKYETGIPFPLARFYARRHHMHSMDRVDWSKPEFGTQLDEYHRAVEVMIRNEALAARGRTDQKRCTSRSSSHLRLV